MSGDDDLARLVALAAADFDEIIQRVLPVVRPQVLGQDQGDGLSDEEIAQALTAVLQEILRVLGSEDTPVSNGLEAVIRRRFGQGVTFPDLLHNYRIGAAAIWQQLHGLIRDDVAASRALLEATPSVFDVIDRFSLRAHQIYHELSISGARRQEQVRATMLDFVLSADMAQGASYWDAAATLGIPRQGHFLVVDAVASATVATDIDWELLLASLTEVESAWFRLGPHSQVGLVALGSSRADPDKIGRILVDKRCTSVGLSAVFTLLSDCRKARAQAHVAAAAATAARPVKRYDRDVLDVLMASSPTAAETLVEVTLGPVMKLPPDWAHILIENVRMWLQHNQSVAATAAAMHCHRNTVNYRLKRFEEVSGRPLSDKPWLTQVYLAVDYVSSTGSTGLTGPPTETLST